jgi:ribosomal protein S18 acetylase RimI-like enzyme
LADGSSGLVGQRELVLITEDDWESQRDIRTAALADAPDMFGSTLADALGFDEQDWRRGIRATTCWQLRQAGMPVGMVRLSVREGGADCDRVGPAAPGRTAYLISMFVAPEARGTGAGEQLVATVAAEAKRLGYQQLWLDVAKHNEAAARLYTRTGFRWAESDGASRHDDRHCELSMVLDL